MSASDNTPNPQSELREAIKFALFTPVHVGHENIEPDEVTTTSDGKDHYIDKLTEIALNYGREQVKTLDVGKIQDAQKIADRSISKRLDPAEAFMQGFRTARNNLQDCKKKFLPPNREKLATQQHSDEQESEEKTCKCLCHTAHVQQHGNPVCSHCKKISCDREDE